MKPLVDPERQRLQVAPDFSTRLFVSVLRLMKSGTRKCSYPSRRRMHSVAKMSARSVGTPGIPPIGVN